MTAEILEQFIPTKDNLGSISTLVPATLPIPHKEAGLNPLVDAAARLFSIVGKLHNLKTCPPLENLRTDLIGELNLFQEAAQNLGYSPEYILVSRYAICATLDDLMAEMPWGKDSAWQSCQSDLAGTDHERFFLILERIIHDPTQYIDLMEFMYICLSFGFKGQFQSTEGHQKLEQIADALYRQIRAHHGNFSRALSPFPIKGVPITKAPPTFSLFSILLSTACLILILFVGLSLTLEIITQSTHTQLANLGSALNEIHS